ncbi:MAG: sigma-70 family RNA polymerase sigma factor [Deltaproteobacteria bacterium]|nr:sigma-70 family RNA polymerase sigma factor [Deltaproteobacteria bacterium]
MRTRDVEDLYARFGHQVFGRCKILLKEEAAAMDITQEVFLRALARPLSFGSDGQAVRWLTQVATNLSLNELRRRRYWRTEELPEGERGGGGDLLGRLVEDRDLVRRLLAAADREVAAAGVGYFLEGRTAMEIAGLLGTSVPTVRRRLHRFLDLARRILERGGES